MKLKTYLLGLPLLVSSVVYADGSTQSTKKDEAIFHFTTQVNRTVQKDLMQAVIYSRKTGRNLAELKKTVAENLNNVLANTKKYPTIEMEAEGVTNYPNYNEKGKVDGWVTEGRINLKSKDFDSMAKVLESLGDKVAISDIYFGVSPEKMVSLEDEMTIEAIKQFQHKADVVQKGLNANGYQLMEVKLDTPNGNNEHYPQARLYAAKMAVGASADSNAMPLEAGKARITAKATGSVKILP